MKKILILLLLFVTFNSKAQVLPNGGFENWTNLLFFYEPQGYVTSNYASLLLGSSGLPRANVFRSTSKKNSGTYSAKLESYAVNTGDTSGVPGIMLTGSIDLNNATISPGFAYNNKPTELRGFYNYALGNRLDSAIVTVVFTKYDPFSAGQLNIVGIGLTYLSENVSSGMQAFSTPIIYIQEETPDTAIILIGTSSTFSGELDSTALANAPVGSILYIDDLSFFGSAVGIEKVDDLLAAQVYPNPATENIKVKFYIADNSSASIELFSIDGKLVYSENRELSKGNQVLNIDFDNYVNGTYQLRIQTELGTIRKKINIIK